MTFDNYVRGLVDQYKPLGIIMQVSHQTYPIFMKLGGLSGHIRHRVSERICGPVAQTVAPILISGNTIHKIHWDSSPLLIIVLLVWM